MLKWSASQRLKEQVIRVAIAPLLTGLKRFDDRVLRGVKVFGRVLIRRAITAADVAADFAQAQMNPAVTCLQAIFTAFGAGCNWLDLIEVGTLKCHGLSLYEQDTAKDAANKILRSM